MKLLFASLAVTLLALLPPPIPPETDISPPPRKPPEPKVEDKEKDKEKEAGPDPAYMTLLPDDGSPWGIKPEVAEKLAAVAAKYFEYAVKFTCTETVRKAKFDGGE